MTMMIQPIWMAWVYILAWWESRIEWYHLSIFSRYTNYSIWTHLYTIRVFEFRNPRLQPWSHVIRSIFQFELQILVNWQVMKLFNSISLNHIPVCQLHNRFNSVIISFEVLPESHVAVDLTTFGNQIDRSYQVYSLYLLDNRNIRQV